MGDNHLAGIWPRGKELLPESGLIRKINTSLPAGSSGFYSRQDAFFFIINNWCKAVLTGVQQ